MPAEVRVRSTPAPLPTTTVTVRADPDTAIDDRTVGARPATGNQGPASVGDAFRDEIRLFLRGFATSRSAAVEVSDDLVSTVRVLPEETGTTVVVFIRQPVTYTVARPTATGEIVIAIKGRPVPPRAGGAQTGTDKDRVQIDAEQLNYDQDSDTMIARGGVTITRGVVTLRADEVRYDRKSGIAEATGNVVVTDPESTIEGSAGHINLNDESGWMEDADADFATSGYTLRSRRLEKGIGPRYCIDEGIFSTCRCGGLDKPSWSVGGKRTDIKLNGIGVVRGATFRVKDVPVLWFPLLAFPALNDRSSGFLMPQFGYSQRRGFQYVQPFFWNISKSQDATVALDVQTSARIGLLGEYRYALSREARGAFAGGYWNENIRSSSADDVLSSSSPVETPPVNRWLTLGHAVQPLDQRRLLYLDAFAVSDDNLLREIHNFSGMLETGLRLRSTRFTRTRTGFLQTWSGGLVQAEADYYQDLIDPQELAIQQAPNLRAEHSMPLLGNLLVGRLAGRVTNFQRNDGFDGFRGDVSPELFLPFQLGRGLFGSVTGRVHGTLYQLGDDQQVAIVIPNDTFVQPTFRVADALSGQPELPPLDRTHLRGVPEVRVRLGSEVSRVFDFPYLGLQKLRHSIEPTVSYLYVPPNNQELGQVALRPCRKVACFKFNKKGECLQPNPDYGVFCNATLFSRGYLFDELDAINRRSFVSYGFTMRLLGRFGGAPEPVPPPALPAVDPLDESEPDEEPEAASGEGAPAAAAHARGARGADPQPLRFTALSRFNPSREINTSHLANLDLGLRLTPVDYLAFTYEASVNLAGGMLNAQSARIDLHETWWTRPPRNVYQSPSTMYLAYRFVEENVNVRPGSAAVQRLFANGGTQNVIGGLYLRLGDNFGFTFGALYDVNGGSSSGNNRTRKLGPHFILRDYLFRVISACNCWAAEVGMSGNRHRRAPVPVQITLSVSGSFGQRGTSGLLRGGAAAVPGDADPQRPRRRSGQLLLSGGLPLAWPGARRWARIPSCGSSSPARPASSGRTSCARPWESTDPLRGTSSGWWRSTSSPTPATSPTWPIWPRIAVPLRASRYRGPCAMGALLREERVDVVVNFAAESHVDRSIADSAPFLHTNVHGTIALLEAARAVGGLQRFLQVSTDEVYGSIAEGHAAEDWPARPSSPYAASKSAADAFVQAYATTFEVPAVITRCSNNYGPYQFPEKLIPLFVTNALDGEPLPLYGDGQNVRDWIHVSDHCAALWHVLGLPDADGRVWNVSAANERPNRAVTDVILDLTGRPRSGAVRDRPARPRPPLRARCWPLACHRLGAAPNVRGGCRRHGGMVSRAPILVGGGQEWRLSRVLSRHVRRPPARSRPERSVTPARAAPPG
jgi:lipopolysaccharide assembly outer membrane protein LptD (OstA)/nucleoside-diphosphate-sugar epimerase